MTEEYGSQSTTVEKDQSNMVGGKLTETVTGDVSEDYKSNLSTKVGGDETHEVTGSQTNKVTGTKTEEVTGKVTETYSAGQDTTVTGDRNETVSGAVNETYGSQKTEVTGDQENTVGGNQTNTITGDQTTTAKNISNTASGDLKNKAANISNEADTSITDKVGNTTVTTTAEGTEFSDGSTKTTIKGDTVTTGTVNADNANISKDLKVGGNTTMGGNLEVAGESTFKGPATFDEAAAFKKGLDAGNNKVTGVANGEISATSTDAINGSQIYGMNQQIDQNTRDIVKTNDRLKRVGAGAAALANLHPLEFDPDSKLNVAAAVGNYRNENATALGLFARPNENVMINISATLGQGDDNMVGGGVSVRLGHGGNKARRAKLDKEETRIKELESRVDVLNTQLDAFLSVLNPKMSKDFPDVPENHWAYEAVSKLAGNDLVQGDPDGKFHGERRMSRYEMAQIIYNALKKGAKAEQKLVEEFRPELNALHAKEQ